MILTKDIDGHPHTGIRCNFLGELVAVLDNESRGVTKGKQYKIIAVQGYGDVEDVIFINDMGNIARAGDWFFKEISAEGG